MSVPAATVVVPTYNRAALVAEAVASVLAQTWEDFELVVVDDGSTDGTAADLAARYGRDPRLRIVTQANAGTAAARNRGLDEARAPLLAFLDSDDLWEPAFLASQRAVLAVHPEADMVLCDAAYVNQDRDADHLFGDPEFHPPTSPAAMCAHAWALPSASLFRTEAVRGLRFRGAYRIIEDTEFLFRFHAAGHRCVLNPERLAIWRRPDGEGAASKTDAAAEMYRETLRLFYEYRHLAADQAAFAATLHAQHRDCAKELVKAGRLRAARPHLLTWWRGRPLRPKPLVLFLRSFLTPGPV